MDESLDWEQLVIPPMFVHSSDLRMFLLKVTQRKLNDSFCSLARGWYHENTELRSMNPCNGVGPRTTLCNKLVHELPHQGIIQNLKKRSIKEVCCCCHVYCVLVNLQSPVKL